MTYKELLELAAKAAGVEAWTDIDGNYYTSDRGGIECPWNPLTDDGDALRLAVKVGLCIDFRLGFAAISLAGSDDAAARRAIVRAAAEIGKTL